MNQFKVPLQSEIQAYLNEKKPEWPTQFTAWYADQIWLFYDQKGWMIGKTKMQRWKSAVSLHFLDPEGKALAELNKFKVIPLKPKRDVLGGIEEIYQQYILHPLRVDNGVLAALYDEMKEKGLMKLTGEQCKICRNLGAILGRSQAVKFAFENRALNRKIR